MWITPLAASGIRIILKLHIPYALDVKKHAVYNSSI